ncbi:uncharacterized protein BO87DRAFT_167313 [Aspergillus neoniger CBS 115656]|uniref:Uncharacterized protein n=1 Tax=Aspergillus neoniger (strain CBS 115656) TaxID=1448310 RepID=A0A318YVZ1_ASPNB|nr:hypothetical protein BO87DRAFT_167313 [Aspergillus neoniger CBS 115656]PYH38404.1 hypothetical protein BO87DRAFT_167313 [Aspergillus neoniger CBS 115656]
MIDDLGCHHHRPSSYPHFSRQRSIPAAPVTYFQPNRTLSTIRPKTTGFVSFHRTFITSRGQRNPWWPVTSRRNRMTTRCPRGGLCAASTFLCTSLPASLTSRRLLRRSRYCGRSSRRWPSAQ